MALINQTVLMSGTDFFSDDSPINAYMNPANPVDQKKAAAEHKAIREALESAGVHVVQVTPPEHCQDGVFTANWALVCDDVAVMARLPKGREAETPYAERVLQQLGKRTVTLPEGLIFSGQGDALPCGKYLFIGNGFRTDKEVHAFIKDILGYEIVSLQAVPKLDAQRNLVFNPITRLPDSYFYDLDIALAVITDSLIAWCPDAFSPRSQKLIRSLGIEKIDVSLDEAKNYFACNLVSTGETVIMGNQAPQLRSELERRGFKVIPLEITELAKGGGFIRCSTLTLDNT